MVSVRPCGGYRVRRFRGRLLVYCQACGNAGSLSARDALRLVSELRGILARFVVAAPAPERARLADLLEKAARAELAAAKRSGPVCRYCYRRHERSPVWRSGCPRAAILV